MNHVIESHTINSLPCSNYGLLRPANEVCEGNVFRGVQGILGQRPPIHLAFFCVIKHWSQLYIKSGYELNGELCKKVEMENVLHDGFVQWVYEHIRSSFPESNQSCDLPSKV